MIEMYNQTPKNAIYSQVVNARTNDVWRVLTEKQFLLSWWAPPEFNLSIININLIPGGAFIFEYTNNRRRHHDELIYVQLIKDRRIVMTNALTKDLRPTTQSYGTIVIDLLDMGNKTQFSSEILFRDTRILRWFAKAGWYQGWVNNIQLMAQLAEKISLLGANQSGSNPHVQS
ncbi:SRPBCC domain-containing protein [Polynucleobacter sp. MWH-Spelu-300-X4]|uniref:SRPBCC domain-containing protein n=1 Tax=Polynucleobacter sp. MWH-Spelu-300-X4 TaxID=2689109 RepID=UPI001BFEA8ED|nr:SRPBCC domain-containing protein [Polynucleobacter sp. MWH-Spelu-300-X4]QWD79246.1 SRPBCC domain-containing protein [Polynucleobacter sp. MWH-Spelu-300-X4]